MKNEKDFDRLLNQENESNEKWDKLVIKYTIIYCYENKEKFADLMPSDLDKLEKVIFENLQAIKPHDLQEFI